MIVPDYAGNGAGANLDDVLVALFELLLEQFAKGLLDLSISPLYRLLNNIEGALFLLSKMAGKVRIDELADFFGGVFC